MNAIMVIGAILLGVVSAALFWKQPVIAKINMLGLSVLLGCVVAIVSLSFGFDQGLFHALVNPPSWKLLAIASVAFFLGLSVLWSLFFERRN